MQSGRDKKDTKDEVFLILHSVRDRLEAIHFEDYYTAYKLSAYYLAYLDVKAE